MPVPSRTRCTADSFRLRRACPMNMRREPGAIELSADVLANVARIDEIWTDCRARYRGPFLFGAFGAADAMFAPVVSRLHTYAVAVGPIARAYMDAVMALPAWARVAGRRDGGALGAAGIRDRVATIAQRQQTGRNSLSRRSLYAAARDDRGPAHESP